MAVADYLVDKSALARVYVPHVAAVLRPLIAAGRTSVCGMAALELGYSALNADEHDHVAAAVRSHEWLHTEDEDFLRAFAVQGLLARSGRRRAISLPDLLLGAIAERHRVTLLHYDADFDLLSEITGQPTRWVVPRGSVA